MTIARHLVSFEEIAVELLGIVVSFLLFSPFVKMFLEKFLALFPELGAFEAFMAFVAVMSAVL